jgi:hypothetical protein
VLLRAGLGGQSGMRVGGVVRRLVLLKCGYWAMVNLDERCLYPRDNPPLLPQRDDFPTTHVRMHGTSDDDDDEIL